MVAVRKNGADEKYLDREKVYSLSICSLRYFYNVFVNQLLFNIDNYKKNNCGVNQKKPNNIEKKEYTNDRIMGNLEGDVVDNTRIKHKKRHLLQSGIQVNVG
ncbi:hypothetical protein [Peribacillus butanolivorans]